MPLNSSSQHLKQGRALPRRSLSARFRRTRILIVGCGDVGLRIVHEFAKSKKAPRFLAMTSDVTRVELLRHAGVTPLYGDLDKLASLHRFKGLASHVVHLAPPKNLGTQDERTRHLLHALSRSPTSMKRLVYVSTSGVYGDCQGRWVDETHEPQAVTMRAKRRVDAERLVRLKAKKSRVRTAVLRAPGIYALNRSHGTPRTRLEKLLPVLRKQDDVFTNHIHADDLARACWFALWRAAPGRVFNANDDTQMKMGDYFDFAAKCFDLPQPERISMEEAQARFSESMLSFWRESRRMVNARLKRELRMTLRYPTIQEGLQPSSESESF